MPIRCKPWMMIKRQPCKRQCDFWVIFGPPFTKQKCVLPYAQIGLGRHLANQNLKGHRILIYRCCDPSTFRVAAAKDRSPFGSSIWYTSLALRTTFDVLMESCCCTSICGRCHRAHARCFRRAHTGCQAGARRDGGTLWQVGQTRCGG